MTSLPRQSVRRSVLVVPTMVAAAAAESSSASSLETFGKEGVATPFVVVESSKGQRTLLLSAIFPFWYSNNESKSTSCSWSWIVYICVICVGLLPLDKTHKVNEKPSYTHTWRSSNVSFCHSFWIQDLENKKWVGAWLCQFGDK